nr:xylulose kinase-1 [Tanacetum cinerariifolium]
MQNFISSSDLLCWNIILKGNIAKSMTTDKDGNLKIRPPVTAEEHQHVQREEKARTILLSALPDEHMGDFYHMIDARDIWNAIKARFGGNAESKKMQKSLLKQRVSVSTGTFAAAAAVSPQSEIEFAFMGLSTENFISSSDLLCWNIVLKRNSAKSMTTDKDGNLKIRPLSNIVLKGNSAKSMTTDKDGNLKIRPPVTTEEHQQVQREEKARTILLSALPDEHMGDFYHMIDARDIWNAIKARFGGNAKSKKMQKSLLKQKFKEFKFLKKKDWTKAMKRCKRF